jgi:hypothetical protein
MNQTTRIVGKTDVVFVVSSAVEGKLGELRLSRAGVDWWPRSSKARFHQAVGSSSATISRGCPPGARFRRDPLVEREAAAMLARE